MKEKLYKQLKIVAFLLFLLIAIWWFGQDAALVERFYSGKLFPVFAIIGQTLVSRVPFSLGDYLYCLFLFVFILFIVNIIRCFFQKNYLKAITHFVQSLIFLLTLIICFYLFWGLNYFRIPLEKRMGLDMNINQSCELLETTVLCIDKANELRRLLRQQDFQRSNQQIFLQAQNLLANSSSLRPYLFSYLPMIKSPITNLHVNYTMVAGYFNPFTQEAQVNTAMPVFSKPFTACHELGHQAGIGFEDEANLVGFILCIESDDLLFRYSAYYNALFMLLAQLAVEDKNAYFNVLKLISRDVLNDAETENAYWKKFDGILNHASSRFYNEYLQLNNQPEGLMRYSRMTKLLIAWKKSSTLKR
ncbi:DUF3810 domain-containing protein [Olivibacter domesticus]|uniref:DUF3810 domain-containing protein n=1 Tax=Olivibacter domesticus TaxID=407022 RepID=A0A1H7PRI3_OLID1|nr:DUF3810 domain-containing protein [Olivibacter domesticus]SEL38471.1 Protein of unknown function [Olivibacter domesticus]